MSHTLYQKYRPKNFSEIIGQTHIVRTLVNSIKNNRIGQAYLFTGPRGTGKTSTARIFAKAINCENLKDAISCEKCPACQAINSGKSLDIIEIDAASNTGVDNIRELRDTIALAPSALKYKVYIIDEVHMLSPGAFNALLKTLEEPPKFVIFILATTKISKVPDTIISRCQRFNFTRLSIPNIIQKLASIAKAEKIKIEKEALDLIALSAEGGMRDAESILGQIIALEDKNISIKEVEEILGTANQKTVSQVAKMIVEKETGASIAKINELLENGYDLQVFNKSLISYFRQMMILRVNSELKKYFSFELPTEQIKEIESLAQKAELAQIISTLNLLLEAQNKITASILPQLPLEIAIIKSTKVIPNANLTLKKTTSTTAKMASLPTSAEKKITKPSKVSATTKLTQKTVTSQNNSPASAEKHSSTHSSTPKQPVISSNQKTVTSSTTLELATVIQSWPQLLIDIRPFNHSLSALLANCQAIAIKNNQITLATPYEFYKDKIEEIKNKLTIEKVLGKILGLDVYISVVIDKNLNFSKNENPIKSEEKDLEASSKIPKSKTGKQENNLLDSALEIFGGKIVD
ncbi:MAG TPA: DNA polymerase III subunit gamma/tau [Candidatus Moranbacteria bacterium]|nr:DNA polymerase III subunit gamma/tau [Candidatus Moranbacteria bacterium]